jgi:uncharacterized protein (DUF1697 family)
MGFGMAVFIALLRAVNVGGTGKLPMSVLKDLCERAGCTNVQTYIASGNVVFRSTKSEARIKAALEAHLLEYAGKPVRVLLRTHAELAAVLEANPFTKTAPNRTMAIFLDSAPAADAIESATGRRDEEIALGTREIYVHYGDGMASSKLKIKAAETGTARNMNTIAKLVELAEAL